MWKPPRRVMVLLEGESLVNDTSGLVLHRRFAVAAALTGSFSLGNAAHGTALPLLGIGGVVFGLAAGFVASFIFARVSEPNFATVVSFLMGWAASCRRRSPGPERRAGRGHAGHGRKPAPA
ncbi:MAG: cation:proton antiporter [Acetobacteraceae bacterium]